MFRTEKMYHLKKKKKWIAATCVKVGTEQQKAVKVSGTNEEEHFATRFIGNRSVT